MADSRFVLSYLPAGVYLVDHRAAQRDHIPAVVGDRLDCGDVSLLLRHPQYDQFQRRKTAAPAAAAGPGVSGADPQQAGGTAGRQHRHYTADAA